MQPKPDENFDPIERIKQPSSRHCFGCGIDNPHGLGLTFYAVGPDRVECDTVLGDRFQGYPGVVHGGIVATMLDEIVGRVLLIGDSTRRFMTAKLVVRYRRPVPTNQPLKVIAWLTRDKGRYATAHSEIRLSDGTLAAESEGTMAEVPGEHMTEEQLEAIGWRVYPD
ncbi:MAG TPA: PaaI family thioesterase [Anaerolineae bacterium]|nr:PaaI family thioesterase [Anaerolineae bacterium]